MVKNTIIYHGTYFKLSENVWAPAYYSTDILQSLGHILTKFDTLNTLNTKDEKSKNDDINKRLDSISNCFPLLYSYNVSKTVNLLKLINPSNFSDTFNKLFNKQELSAAISGKGTPEKFNIIQTFSNKLSGIGIKTPSHVSLTTDFDSSFSILFDIYIKQCDYSCFGGWANTPGYTLLSLIDYNKYFIDIGLMPNKTVVHGIYVERDQDEIILFKNNDCVEHNDISFVLPYEFTDKPIADARTYIDTYIKYATERKNQNDKNRQNFIDHVIKYAYISSDKKWDIDWFMVACDNYDPYTKIIDNCAKDLSCKLRRPLNPDRQASTVLSPDVVDEYFEHCTDPMKSSKLSLLDMDNIGALRNYIDIIKTNWVEKNIGRLKYCSMPSTAADTFRIL